jgi:hypothetical protein
MTLISYRNETARLAPKIILVSNDGVLKIRMPEILMLPNKYLDNIN